MGERTSPWAGRRVLVTGCTGFLGGAVVRELLAAGAGVVGLVRDRAGGEAFTRHQLAGRAWVVYGRVEDGFRLHSALAVHEVGAVFHLAAANPNQPDRGAAAVVEAVRRYDPRTPVVVARPDEAERLDHVPPLPIGVARFGEVFGGGDHKTFRVVPATVLGLLAGDSGLHPVGDTPRDFVHVGDAARACLRLGEHLLDRPGPRLEDHAFRSGWALSDRAMAAAVREAFAGRPVPVPGPPPSNPLGWSPAAAFADALAEAIAWYRESAGTRLVGPKPVGSTHRAAA